MAAGPLAALLGVVLSLVLGPASAQAAAQRQMWTESYTLDHSVFVPCVNHGAGEDVHLRGEAFFRTQAVANDAGRVHYVTHLVHRGVTGVGAVTGDRYRSSYVLHSTSTRAAGWLPMTATLTVGWRISGPGPDSHFRVRFLIHVRYDPDGEIVVYIDRYAVRC